MKYLREFETQAAYNAAKDSLILPNVSLITESNKVEYNPLSPTPSHEYVEIGGVKWATMNIGANSITDTGLYFAWGDTQGYTAAQVGTDKNFTWNDYKYTNDGGSTMSKYNSSDGLTTLQASDDAAQAAWGGNWRMPTTAEFQALGTATTSAWTQVDGVYGLQCTDKTDSSKVLFFPACGYADNGYVFDVGSNGVYWSSSRLSNVQKAYNLNFYVGLVTWDSNKLRYGGLAVRGVLAENS